MKVIIETERIYLREMNKNDYENLSEILQDKGNASLFIFNKKCK
jgi:RimJ/RimL family protein N-acetyltransferase